MFLFFRAKVYLWRDQFQTVFRFYRKPKFALLDISLGFSYFFSNPFTLCRRMMQKRGEKEIYAYGETPLAAWRDIAELAKIGSEDTLLDLGCGRGKLCLWSACWIGCRTIGVDWVPTFVRRGAFLARLFCLQHLSFIQAAISEVSLREATVLYLYTFHPEEERLAFSELGPGARVITISERLVHPHFQTTASLTVQFPWGKTEVFVNQKRREKRLLRPE